MSTASRSRNTTEDEVSAITTGSNTTVSILSQAVRILKGEPPIPEEKEVRDDDDDTILGRHVSTTADGGEVPSNDEDDHMMNSPAAAANGDVFRTTSKDTSTDNNNNINNVETSSTICINFLQDDVKQMTYSRRIALFLMKRYAWYNPALKNDELNESMVEESPDACIHPLLLKKNPSLNAAENVNLLGMQAFPFTHSRREHPSLEKAWAYFEHVALSRYVVKPDDKPEQNKFIKCLIKVFCNANLQLKKAEPGEDEHPTELYEPIFTPHSQLGDFGLGIGLYFSTLRALTVLTLICGIVNIPNMLYYNSSEYTPGESNFNSWQNNTVSHALMKGSAICTDVSWVICEDCLSLDGTRNEFDNNRRGTGINLDNGAMNQTFFLRNNCTQSNFQASMINYGTVIIILFSTIVLNIYLKRMEIAYDEDEQTAQDYSVVVENPPGDATDPQEWHNFFKERFDGAHVTACTIAVNNDLLVRSLVERRELIRRIEMMVEPGTSLDTLTLASIAAKEERGRRFIGKLMAMISPGIPELFARVAVLTAKVQGLAQQDYPATNVFLTFETEAAQRKVLSAYNIGSRDARRNHTSKIDAKHLFRDKHVLLVTEPDEPNTVRWQDLNEKWKEQLKQQLLTSFATLAAIFVIAFLVRVLNDTSIGWSAIAIAVFNSIFPMFAKWLTSFEAHASEGLKQRSLYFKIALFRWVNTAVVITIIVPFTSVLADGELITQIYALFFAEVVTTNAIQILDPVGHLQRHFLAPRAKTQDAMNLNMQGQVFELAERYTNMTKILFLALWYCAIYPGALFICSFALFINYFTDRFSLMRTWKRAPQLGKKISEFSRLYFFSLATVAMAIMSAYYWSGFPFDNLCVSDEYRLNSTLIGTWNITQGSGENITQGSGKIRDPVEVTFDENDKIYKFCLQDFYRFSKEDPSFPFIAAFQLEGQEWMDLDQELISNIFGWSSLGIIILVLLRFFQTWYTGFMSIFHGTYKATGDDQGVPFSEVPSISSYIPQVESAVFSYPLLACNIDKIDEDLLDWNDPDRPHAFYDLTKDATVLLRGMDVSSKVVFSNVAHWPPPDKKREGRQEVRC